MIEKNNSTPVTTASSPAHSTRTSGKWRQAATTSDVEGVSPSQPKTGRRSNKDRANALALAQASREHHRWCQAWMARPFRMWGDRTRLCLGQLVNERVGFMRPRTSHLGGKDHQASLAESSRELWSTVSTGGLGGERHHPPQHNDGVGDRWLGLAKPKWCPQQAGHHRRGADHHDLRTAGIVAGDGKVEVTEEHIGGDTCSRLPTDSRGGILQREPTTPKHPRPRARCTVVAKEVKKTATEAMEATSDGGAAHGRAGGKNGTWARKAQT